MQPGKAQLIIVLLAGTFILLLLCGLIIIFLIFFKERQRQNLLEKAELRDAYERTILTAQIETQNQTFQQVAEDLHDHVGQMLSVVWLHLNCLHEDTQQTPFHASVTELLTHTATLVADVRSLSKSLSTDTITRFGLRACLDLELDRINRAGAAQQSVMKVLGEPYSMGPQTEIILLRMVQEALNNALKHAPGTPIALVLDYKSDYLTIRVSDQGAGFSMASVEARSLSGAGQGVYNLRRRASLLGGTCTWQSGGQQQGTTVLMTIPKVNPIDDSHPLRRSVEWH
ncbi:sensor histidine kinase [uncultured Fibrella sp.]|uniref:sensor histidine kinase n=1 Tax=uncultured Fibrella sp. TaxID=1284596 RepID=UPI0035CBF584